MGGTNPTTLQCTGDKHSGQQTTQIFDSDEERMSGHDKISSAYLSNNCLGEP